MKLLTKSQVVVVVALVLLVISTAALALIHPGPDTTTDPVGDGHPSSALGEQAAQNQAKHLLIAAEAQASRFTADHFALPHSLDDLAQYDVKPGVGDDLTITWKTGFGYCLHSFNKFATDATDEAHALRFDSVTGEHLKVGQKPNPKGACTLA